MALGLGSRPTGESRPLSKADLHPQPKGNILNQSFLVPWKNQCEREGRFLLRSNHCPDHLPSVLTYPVKEGYGRRLNPSWEGWVGVGRFFTDLASGEDCLVLRSDFHFT